MPVFCLGIGTAIGVGCGLMVRLKKMFTIYRGSSTTHEHIVVVPHDESTAKFFSEVLNTVSGNLGFLIGDLDFTIKKYKNNAIEIRIPNKAIKQILEGRGFPLKARLELIPEGSESGEEEREQKRVAKREDSEAVW